MNEEATIVGTLDGITEKTNGWFELSILAPGKQYPVKLATKRSEIVDAARGIGSDVATWTYKESESDKINEHTGKPFINRYLEGVEAGATAALAGQNFPNNKEDVDWDAKERRDFRSRSWAQTISAFQHTIKVDEDPHAVYIRLKPFQILVYEDICKDFAYDAESTDDDDVPF